uniref:Aminotransferase class I/classII domain-containing protein n=1 Tax=Corethron hystrix TaxID=216773 RepID=A0A7S1G1J4_9STRA
MGCHGAAVVSRHAPLASYLVNYARPLVYSTAPGLHSLVAIDHAYRTVAGPEGGRRRRRLFRLVRLFRERCRSAPELRGRVLPSPSPIQAVTFPGNRRCQAAAEELRRGEFDLYPIRFPTVEKGRERIRIVLHAHNKEEEVVALVGALRRVCRRDGAGNVASRL